MALCPTTSHKNLVIVKQTKVETNEVYYSSTTNRFLVP